MNNIEYLGNDIYRFYGFLVSKDEYGFDLSLSEKTTATDQVYFNTFRMIILNTMLWIFLILLSVIVLIQ